MAARYEELRDKLLSWSNRDLEVFGSTEVAEGATDSKAHGQLYDFLRYAADKAYRTLRVPPLEKIYRVTLTDTHITNKCIGIPSDLTEFISITKIGQLQEDGTIRQLVCPIVYNEKVDYRTYRDSYAQHKTNFYWTRQRGNILFDDYGLTAGDVFEIYYYGRLTALNAVYPVDEVTVAAGIYPDLDATPSVEIVNWLRDENERIVLFGALAEAFTFLGEDEMTAKYMQLFKQEIDELNREEEMRKVSGGNIQVQYTSYLL